FLSTGTKGTKTKRSKPKFASDFKQDAAQLLKRNTGISNIVAITASAEYLLPEINRHKIDKLDKVSNQVKTFIDKMRDVVENEKVATGTDKSKTDTLVDDLLHIADLNVWLLKILIIIKEKPYISADLEFVVANRKLNMVAVEDKHIKNIYSPSGFRETQIAANIIACEDENIRATDDKEPIDETIFAIRVLSTHVTFYKASGENSKRKGLDLVEPNRRKAVLEALVNIRTGEENTPATSMPNVSLKKDDE
ncbi:5948_t:CDS:2, partial [Funneliformis caledonium]